MFCDCLPNCADHIFDGSDVFSPFNFLHDNEALFATFLDRKGSPGPLSQRRMALRHRSLDILRIVVTSPDNDKFLQPTRDEKLAVFDEPQVTRAEVRPFTRQS